jgi:serine/threonine protein kinase
LLHGESLRQTLRHGPLPARKAVEYARQISAAHDKRLIHRDLKPDNVFLTASGQVKILDLGLAKAIGNSEAGREGKRADIFSLGATIYEMLAGNRVFQGETPIEALNAVLKEEPPDLENGGIDIAPAPARVVRHCLEKRAADRFQSARDLEFALRSALDLSISAPTHALPVSSAARKIVVVHALGRWSALTRYCGDANLEIDNNPAE